MQENAVNCFYDIMRKKHKNFQVHECGLYLDRVVPYIGGSPDRILTCPCCKPACLEVKCPYSINHLSPCDPDAKLIYLLKDGDGIVLNKSQKYYIHTVSCSNDSYRIITLILYGMDPSWIYY